MYIVIVTNTGGSSSEGSSPVTITDELPEGLSLGASGASGTDELTGSSAGFSCQDTSCTYTGEVVPQDRLILRFPVDVANQEALPRPSPFAPPSCLPVGAITCLINMVRVSGGGAADASMETLTTISHTQAGFGISPGGASTVLSSTQAGAHPDFTTSIAFNTLKGGSLAGDVKDTTDDLPPGFAGDLVDTEACSLSNFSLEECSVGSQIGVATVILTAPGATGTIPVISAVYNLSPNPGDVAKIGFKVSGVEIQGNVSVRPDYGLRVTFENTNESIFELAYVSLTTWGVPASPIHNTWRQKPGGGIQSHRELGASSDAPLAAFFTNPTACEGAPLEAKFTSTSWEHPEQSVEEGMSFGPIVGCDKLSFPATFTAVATTDHASAPSGLDVNLDVAQTYNNAEGLASSTLKKAVVTLPEGMTVNPSAGAGVGACTQAEYEEEELELSATKGCPNDSTLGSVAVETPVFKGKGTGSVFLAQPYANPFHSIEHPSGSLIAVYVVVRFPERGVIAKLAGEVALNGTTGQLVTTFEGVPLNDGEPSLGGLPPVPFNSFEFRFIQGPTSPLVSPPACGSYQVSGAFISWAAPEHVLSEIAPSFPISQGFEENGLCPSGGIPPFDPGVSAGTLDNDAGAYSSLDLRITRNDGEQEITRFSSQLPPGLTANLSGLPFCSDADIELAKTKTGAGEESQPSCPVASEIGHTLVGAGVGSVLAYAPGKVYMAGPYNGAPFSIVAITSAKVGPFDLGTVVVREALQINPETAVVTVDAKASDPIPHIIDGIVIHVRDIRVYINRPDFTLNPTNCEHMTFASTVSGGGADPANPADEMPVTVDNPFQAADCQSLAFKPTFKVSTSGKTSRADGASLTVKLTYPKAPQGTQADIRSVKVDLPKRLPSRLSTLQKACTAAQFDSNPSGCPAASIVGHATAVTPILPVPLTGPAYFVSHGGAKFPELIIVLQGYGVTIDLHSETFISKAGITSGTFHTVPDQPVTSFELTLPEGKYSALAANGNLCKSKLTMPTAFTAQNGDVIHQSTPISVTSCPKAKKVTKKHRKTKPNKQAKK